MKRWLGTAVAAAFFLFAATASAEVIAAYALGALSAESDGSDAIAVMCAGGNVKVNGVDPEGGPAPCGGVEAVELIGGPGPNALDLDAVTAAAFPAATEVVASGDDGDDTIAGSALGDELKGDAGNDTLRGNAGDDGLSGDDGDDRVVGGAGDDRIFATFGSDTLDGQAGSDTYALDLYDLGPTVRVGDTGTEGTDGIDLDDCEGVTIEAGQISREGVRVTVSGIERYPCGFVAPPAPPRPPPSAARKAACVVPKLRGRRLARAKILIVRANCRVGKVTRVRSRLKRGVVVRQAPAGGARRPRGARVALRVSRGP